MGTSKQMIKELMDIDIERDVRQGRIGKVEENVKIKMTIPLLEALGYDTIKDMDFEHHIRNKRADIALIPDNKLKMIVETKDLGEHLDDHVDQTLEYVFNKGVNWSILTKGIETRVYKSFIEGLLPKDRLLFSTTLGELEKKFSQLYDLISRDSLLTEEKLEEKAKQVRESITASRLIRDLGECKEMLFLEFYGQFNERYKSDTTFREAIDSWAKAVKMDVSDPNLIEKLCKEGAYTLLNRLLFLRICEDKEYVKPKLTSEGIKHWREITSEPISELLGFAFREIGRRFEGLYYSPLFDNINYEEIEWKENVINNILKRFGEYDFARITKDILGRAYEQHVSKEERKRLGQFYTPDFIIDFILDKVGVTPERKIIDIACGSGGFLMKAYDRLRKQLLDEGWSEDVIHQKILQDNLYGIDINPFATQLTVMNLLLKDLDHPTSDINIVEGDSLEKLEERLDLDIYEKEAPLGKVVKADKKVSHGKLLRNRPFDIVVGNPPYVSFGLRGAGKIEKRESEYLRKNYPNSAEYKLSTYAIFMDRGIQLLRENGKFGFVVPDSFLLGRYFSKLRRYILDTCKIDEIVLFTKDFWEFGVVGRPVVVILEREPNRNLREGNKLAAELCSTVEDLEGKNFKAYSYEQSYFENIPYNRFRLFFDEESKILVDGMEKGAIKLGGKDGIVSVHTGVRSKIGQKSIISDRKKGPTWEKGLISGGEIDRYSLKYGGHFLNIDPNILFSGGWDPDVILNNKLLLRQTGYNLIATYDDNGYYHLNNLHSIAPENNQYDLKYVLAILNSKLMNHYYHLISLELGRTMAQTDIETIEQLPIKPASQKEQQEFISLVDKILYLNKQLNTPNYADQKREIKEYIRKTDTQIDDTIFELYKISNKEKGMILDLQVKLWRVS